MKRYVKSSLVVTGIVLVLVPAASAALRSPCTLVTNAEAAKALGGRVVDRELKVDRTYKMNTCTWAGPSLGGFSSTHRVASISIYRTTRPEFESTFPPGGARVRGVGEAAFAVNGGRAFLRVYQHGFTLDISVSQVTSPLQAEKALAAAAVKRL